MYVCMYVCMSFFVFTLTLSVLLQVLLCGERLSAMCATPGKCGNNDCDSSIIFLQLMIACMYVYTVCIYTDDKRSIVFVQLQLQYSTRDVQRLVSICTVCIYVCMYVCMYVWICKRWLTAAASALSCRQDIADGSLNLMMTIYRDILPELGGYLTG